MVKEKKDISVFIASSSSNLNKVKAFIQSIKNNDFKLIHDWTDVIINEKNMTQREIDKSMIDDLEAVREADIFIFYQYDNEIISIGSTIELGAALLLNKPIFILAKTTDMTDNVADLLGHSYLDIKNGRTIYHTSCFVELIQTLNLFVEDKLINNTDKTKDILHEAVDILDKPVDKTEYILHEMNAHKDLFDNSYVEKFVNKHLKNIVNDTETNLFKAIEKDLHKQTNYKQNYNLVGHELNQCNELGRKFDDDKLQWDLLPIECIEEIIKTYMYGVTIHAEWNWTKVEPPIRRWWNAANRHLSKIRKDEIKNIEDGNLYHAAQASFNCIAILYHHMRGVRWADDKISKDESVKQSTEQTSKRS